MNKPYSNLLLANLEITTLLAPFVVPISQLQYPWMDGLYLNKPLLGHRVAHLEITRA